MESERNKIVLNKRYTIANVLLSWVTNPPKLSVPYISNLWLPSMFAFEAFLILPMDLILAGYCYKKKEEAYAAALFCAFCSSFSALISYIIGLLAWEQIGKKVINSVISGELFVKLTALYQQYEFPVTFIGGILPIPTKLVTISAGFCHVKITPFFVAILLAKIARFMTIAYIAKNFGPKAIENLKILTNRKTFPTAIVSISLMTNKFLNF